MKSFRIANIKNSNDENNKLIEKYGKNITNVQKKIYSKLLSPRYTKKEKISILKRANNE